MKTKHNKRGFTIIELLTVLSIIIILIAMLVPSLNAVRRFAKVVTQKGQFHDISKGLEMFRIEMAAKFGDTYPDSSYQDLDGESFCGAMKLCEAMVGQDNFGFHPDSIFDDTGQDVDGNNLYFNRTPLPPPENLRERKVRYMEGSEIQIASIEELFSSQTTFEANCPVLCDVFKRNDLRNSNGQKLGMPILYYKADSTKLTHDPNTAVIAAGTNIYNYMDNDELAEIPPPHNGGNPHPLYAGPSGSPDLFYNNTRDKSIRIMSKPHNQNSYILLSAGWDGLYGTRDDIYNFTEE